MRGRAGPVFASIFLPTLKNAEPRGRSGRLSQLENREFSLGSLVGDSASNGLWNGSKASFSIPRRPAVDIAELVGHISTLQRLENGLFFLAITSETSASN